MATFSGGGGGGGGVSLSAANTWTGQQSFTVSPVLHTHGIVSTGAGNGSVTGNAKGTGAHDFQTNRSAATQVASGNYSTVIGYRNTASGLNSIAIGDSNTSSATSGITIGSSNTADELYSVAMGRNSDTLTQGQFCFASGRFSADGDAQKTMSVLRRQTTNATQATLYSDGSTSTNTIKLDGAETFTIHVAARFTSANTVASWIIQGACTRPSSGSSILKWFTIVESSDDAALACTLDTTMVDNGLNVRVTGKAATTINWVATMDAAEVAA